MDEYDQEQLFEDKINIQPKEISNGDDQNEIQEQSHEEQFEEIIEDPKLITVKDLHLEINEGSPNEVLTIKENLEPSPKDQSQEIMELVKEFNMMIRS